MESRDGSSARIWSWKCPSGCGAPNRQEVPPGIKGGEALAGQCRVCGVRRVMVVEPASLSADRRRSKRQSGILQPIRLMELAIRWRCPHCGKEADAVVDGRAKDFRNLPLECRSCRGWGSVGADVTSLVRPTASSGGAPPRGDGT